MKSGNISDDLEIIDTEEKQLQAIADLYAIVKAHPKYKDLKEPVWSEKHTPVDILYWLLRKLGPLADGKDWQIDVFPVGRKSQYCFVEHKGYNSTQVTRSNFTGQHYYSAMQNVYRGEYFIPLDFLPYLLKRDRDLHNLLVDTVALVSKMNDIPLWDEDGDFSKVIERFGDEGNLPIRNNETLYNQMICYTEGAAAHYLDLIKKRRRIVTPATVAAQLSAIRVLNDFKLSSRKYDALMWAENGYYMAKSKKKIAEWWVPKHVHPKAITPYRMYKFIWSIHKNDYVYNHALSSLDRDQKNYRFWLPEEYWITYPGKTKKTSCGEFPVVLSDFMNIGYRIFTARYEQYYYADRLRDERSTSQTLLQKIELLEIKNSAREQKQDQHQNAAAASNNSVRRQARAGILP